MKNRKITDGARSSARQKSKPYPADEEAEICRSTKTVCLASTHKVEKRPSKQTKCGRNSLAKLEMEGLIAKGKDAPFQKRSTETRNSLQRLDETPDNGMISRSMGRRIPTAHAEDTISKENCDVVGTHCLQKRGALPQLAVCEESCQSNASIIPIVEDCSFPNESRGAAWAQQKATLQLDNSVFIDEDSNQPMPLGRFFENADLMQEIPPVVPAYPSMSRREFRQLHFKAKEDLEDEDEDEEDDDDDDDDDDEEN